MLNSSLRDSSFQFLPAGHTPLLATEAPASAVSPLTYVTLRHGGILSLGEDQYRILKRAEDGSWSVARLEKDRLSANFQGNPLWPQQTLTAYPFLSAHFGLSGSSNDQACILPLTATINRRLAELFSGVTPAGPVEFGFSDAASAGPLSDQGYVDQFIDRGLLPLAEVFERDSIHDWSYHFVSFLFQPYLENVRLNLKYIRDHIGVFTGMKAHAWNYYGHTLDEQNQMKGRAVVEEMPYAEAIYRQMAISLDVATAKIVQLLGMHRKGLIEKCRGEVDLIRVFSQGVTFEAIQKILWMEEGLADRLNVADIDTGHVLAGEPMDYLFDTLEALERRAAAIVNPRTVRRREAIFQEVLC